MASGSRWVGGVLCSWLERGCVLRSISRFAIDSFLSLHDHSVQPLGDQHATRTITAADPEDW